MNSFDSHPMNFIENLLDAYREEISTFYFSIYKYKSQTVEDDRRVVSCDSDELIEFYRSLEADLKEGEEIAINSLINGKAGKKHFLMADLVQASFEEEKSRDILNCFSSFSSQKIYLYQSGRSFHLYGLSLVDESDWVKFNGRLLLLNLPNSDVRIDHRWIGHRIIGGYSALRLTNNTRQYLEVPHLVTTFEV